MKSLNTNWVIQCLWNLCLLLSGRITRALSATSRGDFGGKFLIKTQIETWTLKVNKSSEKLAKGDKERLLLFAFINYKCIDYGKSTGISRQLF